MKLRYIVEDHQVIREGVRRYLELAGYKVLSFGNLASVREAFRITKADLLIQDVMLPDGDGFEFVKDLRKSIDVPVIFMTARITEEDRIHGFELGADDYMTKPFDTDELLARIRSLGRRSAGTVCENALSFHDVSLNLSTYELTCRNSSLKLGLKEFCIMELFIKNGSAVISKEQLIEKIWGYDSNAEYNNVEVYISFIRKKLLHIGSEVTIKTVRGVGYSLSAGK